MAALLLSAALGLVHLGAGKLRFLGTTPRSRWLSFASGISVAYVFGHLLPEVAHGQRALEEIGAERFLETEGHVWLLALIGLVVFYGLERMAKASREENEEDGGPDRAEPGVFWLHLSSYGLYNVLVGYLLAEVGGSVGTGDLLFWTAMMLHFTVNDYGLRLHYKARYTNIGRWVLALAVVAGTVLGLVTEVPEAVIASLVAFLAGGVVLNVLKEELPEERESRFWPFALGAASYAGLLTAL